MVRTKMPSVYRKPFIQIPEREPGKSLVRRTASYGLALAGQNSQFIFQTTAKMEGTFRVTGGKARFEWSTSCLRLTGY